MHVRPATDEDIDGIAVARLSNGAAHDDSGADPAYCRHLIADGHLVVAVGADGVLGFGGAVDVGGARLLSDLYVHRDAHGRGIGRVLLDAVMAGSSSRFTFASNDPAALPLYARAGMLAWWPLLSMHGAIDRLDAAGAIVRDIPVGLAGEWELEATGQNRTATYRYWAARSQSHTFSIERADRQIAVAAVRASASSARVEHLAAAEDDALSALGAVAAALGFPSLHVYVPGCRPLAASLMDLGFVIDDTQVFMSSSFGAVPELLQVLHPGLG
jgi:GNAT superfamily N-acetyltransferase